MKTVPIVMTIAGSDSGGGAGIQADLKTFAALGVYGTSVITSITAQNTVSVTDLFNMPKSIISSQIDAIMTDIGSDVVKTGMLANTEIIEIVSEKLTEFTFPIVVVDPVMVATSGDRLISEDAIDILRKMLIPLATVITPNIPEAEVLTERRILTLDDARNAAKDLVAMGAKSAVVKGGHMEGPSTDMVYDGKEFRAYTSKRISSTSTHGTGCTLASAIAAKLAHGYSIRDSVSQAKRYVTASIRNAFPIGSGHGPLNHFYMYWET